jgi:hypothetical protein
VVDVPIAPQETRVVNPDGAAGVLEVAAPEEEFRQRKIKSPSASAVPVVPADMFTATGSVAARF